MLTLLPGRWVNDNILVWWFELLAHETYAARKDLCFLHPGASFLCLFEKPEECGARAARLPALARARAPTRRLTRPLLRARALSPALQARRHLQDAAH